MSQVLDSLEEITCLTDCTVGEAEFLEDVLQDTRLHNLLNVSTDMVVFILHEPVLEKTNNLGSKQV